MSANWLQDLNLYGGKWEVVEENNIPAEVAKRIVSAKVVMSPGRHDDEFDFDGSLQIEITLDNNQKGYWTLSTESELEEGDIVEVSSIKQVVLARAGEDDIYRYDGEKQTKKRAR